MNTVIDSLQTTVNSAKPASSTKDDGVSEDRFLTLLVAQLKNQDPLNPLDNAQVTSQMAQISTVGGIEKLNTSFASLNSQLVQLQAMQGVSLVGRGVTVPGDQLAVAGGVAEGQFELAGTANRVKVEVLSSAGKVVDTLELGTHSAGTHSFNWAAKGVSDGADYRFRVTATQGTAAVASTALMNDTVRAVSAGGKGITLELERGGTLAYDKVRSFR